MEFGASVFFTDYSILPPGRRWRWRNVASPRSGSRAFAHPDLAAHPGAGGGVVVISATRSRTVKRVTSIDQDYCKRRGRECWRSRAIWTTARILDVLTNDPPGRAL
jgi:hypothetical protein